MNRKLAIPLAVVAALLGACADEPATSIAPPEAHIAPLLSAAPRAEVLPGRYIVVFRDDVGNAPELAARLAAAHGGTLHHTYEHALKGFAAALPVQAVEALRRNPHVAFIQPNQAARPTAVTQTSAPWGLDRIDQEQGRDGTFTYEYNGKGVTVYVIDSGIYLAHPDFGNRARFGTDVCWDNQCNQNDGLGHGTQVAGIIGGTRYGVAKGVNLVSVRVLGDSARNGITGDAASIIKGVDWVTAQKATYSTARMVANVSLGVAADSALDLAVRKSIAKGVTYVVGAGNKVEDACGTSPARVPEAVTVGAIDRVDALWRNSNSATVGSNYGSCVDVYAPGESITTTRTGGGSTSVTGTSFAAPHVTGFAAMYLQAFPRSSPADIHAAVISWSTKGRIPSLGAGSHNRILFTRFEPIATVEWVQPASVSWGEPNTLTAAGLVRNGSGTVQLLYRDASINAPWATSYWAPSPDAYGQWSNTIPSSSNYCHDYEVQAKYSGVVSAVFTYRGLTSGYCNEQARLIWIQPQPQAGMGTPGALVVAGEATGAPAGTTVTMWWRNVSTAGAWVKAPYAAPTDANGIWLNEIPNADYGQQYAVYVKYDVVQSDTCTYAGANDKTWC